MRVSGVEGGPLMVRRREGFGLLLVYLMAALAMGSPCLHPGLLLRVLEAPLADPHHSHSFPATLWWCLGPFCVPSPLCHRIPISTVSAVSLHPQHLSVHRLTPQSLDVHGQRFL